jgi:hypothetical protein
VQVASCALRSGARKASKPINNKEAEREITRLLQEADRRKMRLLGVAATATIQRLVFSIPETTGFLKMRQYLSKPEAEALGLFVRQLLKTVC